MGYINKVIGNYGYAGILTLMIYPISTLFTTPVQLGRTFWRSRVLLRNNGWGNYTNHQVRKALNYLFYKTVYQNMNRFGRSGTSTIMGWGDFDMRRHFHYAKPALSCYSKYGMTFILLCMMVYVFSHLIWMNHVEPLFCGCTIILLLISTTFYANVFGHQNYNALGWALFPVFIYGLIRGEWTIASISLLLCSFGSITVVAIGCILCTCVAVHEQSYYPLLSLCPVAIKLSLQLISVIKNNDFTIFTDILKIIGVSKNKVRYIRNRSRVINLRNLFYIIPFFLLIINICIVDEEIPYILIFSLAVLLFNLFFRFADKQSMQMLMISAATAVVVNSQSYGLLPCFWLAISPPALILIFPHISNILVTVPVLEPFNTNEIVQKITQFLSPVHENDRVLMCFNDPNSQYENIFDGYRVLLEPLIYAATLRNILCIPNWFCIIESNYIGSPDCWGREPDMVIKNIRKWNIDHVIVYQTDSQGIDNKWLDAGFTLEGKFSWKTQNLREVQPYSGESPDWFLLSYN